MTALMAALAGANLIYGAGMTESGVTFDYAQYVLDNDIAGMVKHVVQGVPVNDTTLALDRIARVQPAAGFLADDHTLDNWKWAQWKPDIIDRNRYERWESLGRKEMFARANERARTLLIGHHPEPLSDEVEAVIADVLAQRAARS